MKTFKQYFQKNESYNEQEIDIDYQGDMADADQEEELYYLKDWHSKHDTSVFISSYTGYLDTYDANYEIELSNGDTIDYNYKGHPNGNDNFEIYINNRNVSRYGHYYMEELGDSINYAVEIPLVMYDEFIGKELFYREYR